MTGHNTGNGASSAEGAPRSKPEPRKVRGVFERVKGSNVWWIHYYDQFSRRHYEKVGSRAVAIAAYQKRKTDIREGRFVGIRPKRISWRELCDDLQARGFHKPGLLEAVRAWFGERSAVSIMPQDIQTKLNGLTAAGLAPATVNRHRAMCSSIFSWAIENGKATTNPIPKVKRLRENNERVRYLAPEEETRLRQAIRELAADQETEFDLALNTGMRWSEQYNLEWSQVNFGSEMITLLRTKNGKVRHIPINTTARHALETLALRPKAHRRGRVCDFPGKYPKSFHRFWWTSCLHKAGIADFHWHDLRHSFASRLVMAGVDIRTVQELMGHQSIAMTMRYSHISGGHAREAIARLCPRKVG